jgi:predicted O-methyltransferase YrrM
MGVPHTIYPEILGYMYNGDLLHLRKRCQETKELGGPILEIGSYCGLSTAILSEGGARVTCIDTFQGGEDLPNRYTRPIFDKNMKKLGRYSQLTVLESRSDNALMDLLPEYRLAFVDGSHTYEDASLDIRACWGLLKRGGWLIVDDVPWGGPEFPVANAMRDSGLPFQGVKDSKLGEAQKG